MTQRRTIGLVTAAASLLVIALATLTPVELDEPLLGSWWCLQCGSLALADAISNVVLFIPAGMGVGLFARRAVRGVVGLGLVSLLIEAVQVWLVPGRDSSLRDVITNTIGGAAGIGLITHWRVLLAPRAPIASRLALGAAGVWAMTLGTTAFLLRPSTPLDEFYGQRGGGRTFADLVTQVAVNGIRLPHGRLSDPAPVVAALNSDTVVVDVAVLPGAEQIAGAIARLSNYRTEAFRIVHRGDGLAFSLRMRSADARLRTPIVRSAGGLPPGREVTNGPEGLADDTLLIRGSFRGGVLRLEREDAPATPSQLTLAPTTGWVLLAPPGITSRFPAWALNGAWIAALLLPVGYWTAGARQGSHGDTGRDRRPARPRALLVGVATLVLGAFVVVPPVAGAPWPSWSDWCFGLAGGTAGVLASIVLRKVGTLRPED